MHAQPILVRDEFGHRSVGLGHVVHHSRSWRWTKASFYLVVGVVLGLTTALIPFVQFYGPVLFPSLGLLLAAYALQIRDHVDHARVTCPHCGDAIVLDGDGPQFPLTDSCPSCRHLLTVEPTDEIELSAAEREELAAMA